MTIRFDPRLRVPDSAMYDIELAAADPLERVTVFMTDRYNFLLAAEIVGEEILIRAATGDEVSEFLTSGAVEDEENRDWPGDPAESTGHRIEWQEAANGEPAIEEACRLSSGEILFPSGRGVAGPFYVHEQAARGGAFSEALRLPGSEVFKAQVVPYACAKGFAPALLRGGDGEYRRLNRFWAPPIRPWGQPAVIPVPG